MPALSQASAGQVDAAVRRWFGENDPRAEELIAHLQRESTVRAMLRGPLLLRLACQSATRSLAAGKPLRLWRRPAELFDDLIDNARQVWKEKTAVKPTMLEESGFDGFTAEVAWLLWREDPGWTLFGPVGNLVSGTRFG